MKYMNLLRYQTSLINPILFYFKPVDDGTKIENILKAKLKNYRIKTNDGKYTEWFLLELINIIITIENIFNDNFVNKDDTEFSQVNTKPFEKNWKNVRFENDPVASFFENNYEKTEKETDAIEKFELLEHFKQVTGKQNYIWNTFLYDIKHLGFIYNRSKQIKGKRGAVIGLVRKENTEQYNNNVDFIDN